MYKNNNKGFSLLEVMVVVGIIGILTSIALPAYNNYRDTAARSSLTTSLSAIEKAYNACMAVGSGDCNDLGKIGLSECQGCKIADSSGFGSADADPDFCVHKEQKLGSNLYRGCVSVDESSGRSTKTIGFYKDDGSTAIEKGFCYCDVNADQTAHPAEASLQDGGVLCTPGQHSTECPSCDPSPSTATVTHECKSQKGMCKTDGNCE